MTTETVEQRLHRICCSARDTYFNEEQAGKLPNLALIIRDAVLDYASAWQAGQTEAVAWMYFNPTMCTSNLNPRYCATRWGVCNKPLIETALYAAPPAAPADIVKKDLYEKARKLNERKLT